MTSSNTIMTMSMSMASMVDYVRMVSFPIILYFHDGTTIVTISMVYDMLDPPIRKVYMVLSLNISSCIASPYFTEVCVILVIMHSILEVERIRTVVITTSVTTSMTASMTTSMTTSMTSSNKSSCRFSKSKT